MNRKPKGRGSLRVVGTGIRVISQTPPDAVACIRQASVVYFLGDTVTEVWLRRLNGTVEPLHAFYGTRKDRSTTYEEIVEHVLAGVRAGHDVCLAVYGHPGVFAFPAHEAMRRARAEGFDAKMLPGISAEDCLFADLGVDPGAAGCQSFEATDFLLYKRIFDTRSALILWQIGVIAEPSVKSKPDIWNREGLRVLADVLITHYGADHEVTVYEAARLAFCKPVILTMPLRLLPEAKAPTLSTLYVPSKEVGKQDPEMARRLIGTRTE